MILSYHSSNNNNNNNNNNPMIEQNLIIKTNYNHTPEQLRGYSLHKNKICTLSEYRYENIGKENYHMNSTCHCIAQLL